MVLSAGLVGMATLTAFTLAASVLAENKRQKIMLAISALILLIGIDRLGVLSISLASLLLVTIVHVYVFTACFVLAGAIRNRSLSASFTLAGMIGAALICITSGGTYALTSEMPKGIGVEIFSEWVAVVLKGVGLETTAQNRISTFSFLSFAYTYHYLNWFSKTRFIQWHKISHQRGWGMIGLYAVFLGVYLYDYQLGFTFILFLSLLHVYLEFPLNWKVFREIGMSVLPSLKRN
jgi:hypothetical protein